MFSKRTQWNLTKNRLTQLLEEKRNQGISIIDLTESNPTHCHFHYPEKDIHSAFQNPNNLVYTPHSKGLLSTRSNIVGYYKTYSKTLNPDNLFLTASSSEGYSFLFRLLTNPGDSILVPQPSYPLFQLLAEINDIQLQQYRLIYKDSWKIDFESIEKIIGHRTKAIILVNPNNPTGSFIKKNEYNKLIDLCKEHNLAIISDEVFSDYSYEKDPNRISTFAGTDEILTFVLNGISKMLALPQMKLGWIYTSGPKKTVLEAMARLEMITDTYLSVNTPIQHALPDLLHFRKPIQQQIVNRILENRNQLAKTIQSTSSQFIQPEGGWNAVLRLENEVDEDNLVFNLLETENLLIHPGYFYDFEKEGYLVLSLLPTEDIFQEGVSRLVSKITK